MLILPFGYDHPRDRISAVVLFAVNGERAAGDAAAYMEPTRFIGGETLLIPTE